MCRLNRFTQACHLSPAHLGNRSVSTSRTAVLLLLIIITIIIMDIVSILSDSRITVASCCPRDYCVQHFKRVVRVDLTRQKKLQQLDNETYDPIDGCSKVLGGFSYRSSGHRVHLLSDDGERCTECNFNVTSTVRSSTRKISHVPATMMKRISTERFCALSVPSFSEPVRL